MTDLLYSKLLSPLCPTVAEPQHQYHFMTERHIQAMWFEQKYFRSICTSTGVDVEVISPGIWNAEAGPDFKKAHLKIGSQTFYGDVEIHLSDENWTHHQHHLDPRYNQVILHISLWKPKKEQSLIKENGQSIPQVHLESFLTISESRILQLIDLDLYPYRKFTGSGRCAQTLFRKLPDNQAQRFFQTAAYHRLKQKHAYLEVRTSNPALQMGAGIAMALGYKNNTESFLDLFFWLHSLPTRIEEELLSLALGVSGFFEDKYREKWKNSQKYTSLHQLFQKIAPSSFRSIRIRLNQTRPLNHPVRRQAFLAKLVSDPMLPHYYSHLHKMWKQEFPHRNWKKLHRMLAEQLPNYRDPYWNTHYTFDSLSKDTFLALVGKDLHQAILINTFFPILAHGIDDAEEWGAFKEFYASLPAEKNGKGRYMTHRLFGETGKGQSLQQADTEQGAYQLHHDFCVHYEASCEGCPFVDRYEKMYEKRRE